MRNNYKCKKIIFTFVKTFLWKIVFFARDVCLFFVSLTYVRFMDLIKDRLAHILRAKNLTATQFAEMMHIQPSNVSHLLSGRNKPSLDFLMKLKEIFPEYSFDWIILGKKPITVSDTNTISRNTLFDEVDDVTTENKEIVDEEIGVVDEVKPPLYNIDYNSKTEHSLGLKQIIYVYDDHTFEILNIRK